MTPVNDLHQFALLLTGSSEKGFHFNSSCFNSSFSVLLQQSCFALFS